MWVLPESQRPRAATRSEQNSSTALKKIEILLASYRFQKPWIFTVNEKRKSNGNGVFGGWPSRGVCFWARATVLLCVCLANLLQRFETFVSFVFGCQPIVLQYFIVIQSETWEDSNLVTSYRKFPSSQVRVLGHVCFCVRVLCVCELLLLLPRCCCCVLLLRAVICCLCVVVCLCLYSKVMCCVCVVVLFVCCCLFCLCINRLFVVMQMAEVSPSSPVCCI